MVNDGIDSIGIRLLQPGKYKQQNKHKNNTFHGLLKGVCNNSVHPTIIIMKGHVNHIII